jgi:hypothetical protein
MGEPVNNQDWQEDLKQNWIPFCKRQIHRHRNIIWVLTGFTCLEVVIGIALTVLAFIYVRTDTSKLGDIFFKLGPMFIVAPFPAVQYIKIIRSKQARDTYESWKDELQDAIDQDLYPESLIKDLNANKSALALPN